MQKRELVMERFRRIERGDRSFDIQFWRRQTPTARVKAMSELAEGYHRNKAGVNSGF